jgi:hypothetical protein
MIAVPVAHHVVAAAPACQPGQLHLGLSTVGGGTAGTFYVTIVILNESPHGCTLRGFPGVSSVSSSGGQIGSPARREGQGTPVRTVTLGAYRLAHAVYGQHDAGAIDGCRIANAAGLRVYPPGSTRSYVLPWPHQACANAGAGDSLIQPVQPFALDVS